MYEAWQFSICTVFTDSTSLNFFWTAVVFLKAVPSYSYTWIPAVSFCWSTTRSHSPGSCLEPSGFTYIHTYISHIISPKYNGHETGHRHNTNKQSRKTIHSLKIDPLRWFFMVGRRKNSHGVDLMSKHGVPGPL
jgi:hypothetical protein